MTASQEVLLLHGHQESVFVANALAVAIAKRTAVSWARTQANTRKYACQVAKTQTQPPQRNSTTLLHNQHRATRQYPRQREWNPCLHLPARSPRREKIKVWMTTQTRGEILQVVTCTRQVPNNWLETCVQRFAPADRVGYCDHTQRSMSERADPSRRICVKCYDSRATDTPNRQRKTPLKGHSPLQSYFFMPVCAFRSDEKKRGRTRSSISDRFYDGNSVVDLLKKNVCLRSSFRVRTADEEGAGNTFQAAFEQKTTAPHATNCLLRHCARALRTCVTVTER